MTTTTAHETAHEKTHEKTHENTRAAAGHAARTWQDEYFTFVKRIEGPVLRTTTRAAARFAEIVPARPSFLASMPKAHAVRDVMDTGFTFRKRMVEEQTLFARRMMTAMEPMLETLDTVHADDVPGKLSVPVTRATTRATTPAREMEQAATHVKQAMRPTVQATKRALTKRTPTERRPARTASRRAA